MPKKMKVVRATGTKLLNESYDDLPVPLTEKDLVQRATSLTRLEDEERKVTAEYETHKTAHKNAVKIIAAERGRLLQAIRDRRELQCVKVHHMAHYDVGQYRAVRTDTGEVVHERPLTPAEMQDEPPFAHSEVPEPLA